MSAVTTRTRDWIYIAVEDAASDVMGVMELFDVDQDEAVAVVDESLRWLKTDPIEIL